MTAKFYAMKIAVNYRTILKVIAEEASKTNDPIVTVSMGDGDNITFDFGNCKIELELMTRGYLVKTSSMNETSASVIAALRSFVSDNPTKEIA